MNPLSKTGLEKHWRSTANEFRAEYSLWIKVFWDLVSEASEVLNLLEGKRQLAENCSYLLLSKTLNHALAMFSLAERGLCIDAALCCRNAIESLLLLQLLLLDSSEDLYTRWAKGEEFKPGWVRNELKTKSRSEVRSVIVTFDHETHDLNRFVYGWLSNITHANLDSSNHAVKPTGQNSFEVFTGGSVHGKESFLNALFSVTCDGLHGTAVLCVAIFDPIQLEKNGSRWSSIQKRINDATRVPESP